MVLRNKAQASIEIMISVLIVLFLFTVVFIISIMKSNDINSTDELLTNREDCIKLSSLLFLTSVFNYKNEVSLKSSSEISRDKSLINIYKVFCYGYTRDLDKIIYNLEPGKFKIVKKDGGIKIEKS